MNDSAVQELDQKLEAGDGTAGLEFLIEQFRESGSYGLLFEARLMRKRLDLGLALVQTEAPSEFPPHIRVAYDQAMIEAAREAGEMALRLGDIPGSWPYFRAIGEPERVAAAIESFSGEEVPEGVIQIAFQEGVHPAKGMELMVAQYGMCRAITAFGMYPVQKGRSECISFLVRKLYEEVLGRMSHAVEAEEGTAPASRRITHLIAGRDWLFGEYSTYVDTSHLHSLLPYSTEIDDRETLELFHELCEYGKRLSPMFQARGQPPFDDPFSDYGHYVLARLGIDSDQHLQHFRNKLEESDPEEAGTAPAELLVNLLVQLRRYSEAVEVYVEYLTDAPPGLACPSLLRLCHLAGDYSRMKEIARGKGDLLSYVAASVLAKGERARTVRPSV